RRLSGFGEATGLPTDSEACLGTSHETGPGAWRVPGDRDRLRSRWEKRPLGLPRYGSRRATPSLNLHRSLPPLAAPSTTTTARHQLAITANVSSSSRVKLLACR